MKIRKASAHDADRVRDIARAAYALYVARIGREPAPMAADFETHIRRDEVMLAETTEGIIGYIVAYPRADDYFVENVAVDPARAGAGVGKNLMSQAESAAVQHGCRFIRLYTNVAMYENFPFYESLGYRKTHEATEAGFHRVYFEKSLEQR
ncbi:MAG: GNAT family N-acetyltransferase [Rhodospirillales bacterium]|nr:GNAT family N-acetyltransferase [Rhodospirillales bacterium]